MSGRSHRQGTRSIKQASVEEYKRMLMQDDDESLSSSEGSSGYSDGGEVEDDDDFVTGGQWADDFETEREAKKKKPVKKEQTSLAEFLEKNKQKVQNKARPAPKPVSTGNDDKQINDLLAELDAGASRTSKRKEKRKRVQKTKEFASREYVRRDEEEFDMGEDVPHEVEAPVAPREVEKPQPVVVVEKERPREVAPAPKMNFEIEAVSGEGLDLTGEAVESAERVDVPVPENGVMDMFLFHVHEEEGQLYLFCKYNLKGKFYTICLRIALLYYTLQFLPIDGRIEELKEEVKSVARKCKGICLGEPEVERMKYCFDNVSIDRDADWVVARFSPKAQLQDIPQEGNHYSNVFGITATLAEGFLVRTRIMGPCWIRVHNVQKAEQQVSSVPMVTIKNGDGIEVLRDSTPPIPPFNLCSFALRASYNQQKKKNQVYMISMDFKLDWDIENFCPAVKDKAKQARMTLLCPISGTGLNSECVKELQNNKKTIYHVFDKERDLLKAFVDKLEEMDVDFISSYGLTTFDMPLILDRLHEHNVQTFWKVGRLKRNRSTKKAKLAVVIGGRLPVDTRVMCSEFWRSKANDFSSIVKEIFGADRQVLDHFDIAPKLSEKESLRNLVNYNLADSLFVTRILQKIQILPLTLQISRLSGCPWQRVLLGKASPRCESLLLHKFSMFHYVIPEKQQAEGILKREAKYKGGKVLSPERGFYETCICVLDFNSLYPSIIREFNICFTTVDKSHPSAQAARAKRDKERKEGILPQIMEMLLMARQTVKQDLAKWNQQKESAPPGRQRDAIDVEIVRLQIKEKAIKVLANSMYGYLGFKTSRFQANHLAALITECGREILEDTAKFMENQQYKVVYGDTDSVMINSNTRNPVDATRIARELSSKISEKYRFLKLGVDYIFQKMLLVAKKKYAAMVYLGPDKTRIDTKGLDMVRRDWSEVTKRLSSYIIGEFMSGKERDEANESVLKELETISSMMRNGGELQEGQVCNTFPEGIKVVDLAITKALKKPLDQYPPTNASAHVVVARAMAANGENVSLNATIQYVICKSESRDLGSKARRPGDIADFRDADIEWYLSNQLLHPLWRLCEPFGGMTIGMLSQALGLAYAQPIIDSGTSRHSKPASSIPRICELAYQCLGCGRQNTIDVDRDPSELFVCQNLECKFCHSPKYVANELTRFVRHFLTEFRGSRVKEDVKSFKCSGILCNYKTGQLPVRALAPAHYNVYKQNEKLCNGHLVPVVSSIDIFNTLRYWKELFKGECCDNAEFKEYMVQFMDSVLKVHQFSKLSFRSLFAPQAVAEHREEEEEPEDSDSD